MALVVVVGVVYFLKSLRSRSGRLRVACRGLLDFQPDFARLALGWGEEEAAVVGTQIGCRVDGGLHGVRGSESPETGFQPGRVRQGLLRSRDV